MEELFIDFLNNHLYKQTLGIGLAYGCVLIAMLIDLISGIRKAKLCHQATTSTGLKKTAEKARKYFTPMVILTVIDIMLCMHIKIPVFTFVWAAFLCFCEFKSVAEKSWQKAELREAANTMNVIIKNKEDLAKVLIEVIGDMKESDEKETQKKDSITIHGSNSGVVENNGTIENIGCNNINI